ncbi:MAG: hypothetical protein FWE17_00720 [Alphaproteobacteria bacterium]|nr:hypothetical protein [Alphaproteobacteria bacterium]MCL2758216.1 hypothetical protein [Alphaproteobacteria bacterium]
MTREEFISELEKRGAVLLPHASARALELAQNALQQMRAAMMPPVLSDIYKSIAGGMIAGDSNIFGTEDIARPGRNYEIPSLIQINREVSGLPGTAGRTIFGRNQMFWFAFDAFGNFYMLDILNLNALREYGGDAYRAILDCLAVGKI